jgi:hypothetical protein
MIGGCLRGERAHFLWPIFEVKRAGNRHFPSTLDELIADDHVCRVSEAFVGKLDKEGPGLTSVGGTWK